MADIIDIEKKKKGRPRLTEEQKAENKRKRKTGELPTHRRKRPDLEHYGYENAEPGDNARYLRQALVAWDLPPIDISDPAQIEKRIMEYFSYCIQEDKKPNVVGMANWLGVEKNTIHEWKQGNVRSSSHSYIIKRALSILEDQWVDYMQNGKINPASGIFLGKNMFGYKDTQDIKVAPPNPMGELQSPEDIKRRIEASIPCDVEE